MNLLVRSNILGDTIESSRLHMGRLERNPLRRGEPCSTPAVIDVELLIATYESEKRLCIAYGYFFSLALAVHNNIASLRFLIVNSDWSISCYRFDHQMAHLRSARVHPLSNGLMPSQGVASSALWLFAPPSLNAFPAFATIALHTWVGARTFISR